MRYLGIDPGLGGAVALLPGQLSGVVVWDTPVVEIGTRGKHRRTYLLQDMLALLRDTMRDGQVRAVIEQVAPFPGEGVVSACRMGFGDGVWQALLVALAIPYRVVHPSVWKRHAGLLGKDKNAVRLAAAQRFPGVDLGRVKDHGRAEALFLADTGRRLDW